MAYFLISYDLISPGKDYSRLTTALTQAGAQRVLLSTWAMSADNSARGIRDWLKQFVDENDRLAVTQITSTTYATWNAMEPGKTWLDRNVI